MKQRYHVIPDHTALAAFKTIAIKAGLWKLNLAERLHANGDQRAALREVDAALGLLQDHPFALALRFQVFEVLQAKNRERKRQAKVLQRKRNAHMDEFAILQTLVNDGGESRQNRVTVACGRCLCG